MAGEVDAGASSGCGLGQGCGSCAPENVVPGKVDGVPICVKCKQGIAAKVIANQTEPLCQDCLHQSLLSKFKTAVNKYGLVTASDKVLVAFSGGPASRVALDFLLHLRAKAQGDADGSKEQKLPVFEVGVAFVDESTLLGMSAAESVRSHEDIRAAVFSASTQLIPLHVEPLQSAMAVEGAGTHTDTLDNGCILDCEDVGRKLLDLFGSIKDETGKEDLQERLRMLVLQKVARTHGYTKVIMGLSVSRIAAHVIASTAKGRGFSLPADVQYVDSRFDVPVVFPLKDCVARELVLYCHFAKLKTVFIKKPSTLLGNKTINSLAHSFVAMLQEENPSREHTIVRTASKLKPFKFNSLWTTSLKPLRRGRQECVNSEVQAAESFVLCPLCYAPLEKRDYLATPLLGDKTPTCPNHDSARLSSPAHDFRSMCCPSCQFQFLAEDNTSSTFQLLPLLLKQQDFLRSKCNQSWMRSEIEEYLI